MLNVIKLLHTVIWAFLAGSIVALPVAGVLRRFRWAAIITVVVLLESGLLAINGGRCPLTDLAARYTAEVPKKIGIATVGHTSAMPLIAITSSIGLKVFNAAPKCPKAGNENGDCNRYPANNLAPCGSSTARRCDDRSLSLSLARSFGTAAGVIIIPTKNMLILAAESVIRITLRGEKVLLGFELDFA